MTPTLDRLQPDEATPSGGFAYAASGTYGWFYVWDEDFASARDWAVELASISEPRPAEPAARRQRR
jgi:hypothetical protein